MRELRINPYEILTVGDQGAWPGRGVRIVKIVRSRRDECRLNQSVKGTVLVPGFGASDCTAGCGAHLKFCGEH